MLALFSHEYISKIQTISDVLSESLLHYFCIVCKNGINDHTFHLLDIDEGTDW